MKTKFLFLWLIFLLVATACSSDDDDKVQTVLEIKPEILTLNAEGERQPVVISSTESWVAGCEETWCTMTPGNGGGGTDTLWIAAEENTTTSQREAVVVISSGMLTRRLNILQNAFVTDGSVYTYLKASQGKGVKIVVMGDGFTAADVVPGGKYDRCMEQAVEHLLDIEPFKSYRSYFTAYVVRAVSNDEGISDYSEGRDTRFRSRYTSKTSTIMTCDTSVCFNYACKAPIDNKLDETLVILVTNSSRYAGSTYMYTGGAAIAICPMAEQLPYNNFKGIVQHEAGGHGFAKLVDEYIYNAETIPESSVKIIRENEAYGFYANVDLTDDLSQIKWKHFIGLTGYEVVGAYEGGYKYAKGIWRPEQISCMDDMRPYFNAPSREAIVKRICYLAGLTYSLEDFLANDKGRGTAPAALLSAPSAATLPLPAPVIIKGSPALNQ